MQNYDCFLLAKCVGKRVSYYNLGHTFLIDTRMEPLSAQKKNLEKHNLTGGLVFKFPVLFTALLEFILGLTKRCC